MPRNKPTRKLDFIGDLDLNPDKCVSVLTESLKQKKLFIKRPTWDTAGDGIELLAIQNEREYLDLLQLQSIFREHDERQKIINSSRIEELYKTQDDLRNRFIEANNFFKECDDKKKNAEAKVQEEKQLHTDFKQSIQMFKINIDKLTVFRNTLKDLVKQFEPYEKVINEVVTQGDNWSSVKDCMARCDALMMTQVEISEMKRKTLQEMDDMRQNIVRLTTEAALTVLGLNNELGELERAYNAAANESLKWEKMIVKVKNCIVENSLVKSRMMDAIQAMHLLLCNRLGMSSHLKKIDFERELDFVRDEIRILTQVVHECRKTKS